MDKTIDALAVMEADARALANYLWSDDGTHANECLLREKASEKARAAVAELIEAGKALSFAAQITGGVAGADANLQAAIERHSIALARVGGAVEPCEECDGKGERENRFGRMDACDTCDGTGRFGGAQ